VIAAKVRLAARLVRAQESKITWDFPAASSQYLGHTRVEGGNHLESVHWKNKGQTEEHMISHIFIMTGANSWLDDCLALGFIKTGPDLSQENFSAAQCLHAVMVSSLIIMVAIVNDKAMTLIMLIPYV
jgi:hypothetical protein